MTNHYSFYGRIIIIYSIHILFIFIQKSMVKSEIKSKWYFNIFVEKISKKKWKLLYWKDIERTISNIMWENYSRAKWYKLVHQAKNRWHIYVLKKDVYYIPQSWEEIDNIVAKYYRPILHTHIKLYCNNKGIITWTTALQLMMQNYELPDSIDVISYNKQCQEVVVQDKIIAIKKMTSSKQSLFSYILKTAKKTSIQGKSFMLSSLGISLMESLYATTMSDTLHMELCKKVLRKSWKLIDRDEIIFFLRKGKYHSSINKLHILSRGIDDAYADHIMNIIKKHSYRISI